MLSSKLIKEIHGLEIEWQVPGMSKTWSAVILSSKENGVSIKPYFKDVEEREEFITEYCAISKKSRKVFIKELNDPTFCFAHISAAGKVEIIRRVIKDCNINSIESGSNPICPFA